MNQILVVAVLILSPAQGEVEIQHTKHEMPIADCKEMVAERAAELAKTWERVSGFCYALPPKPQGRPTL